MIEAIAKKLVEDEKITAEKLKEAEKYSKSQNQSLEISLLKVGAIPEDLLLTELASYYSVPSLDLANAEIDPGAIKLLPADVASRFRVVPVRRVGRKLTVAMTNPTNLFAVDDIKFITGYEVEPVVALEETIKKAIDRYYDSAESLAAVMKNLDDELEIVEEETPSDVATDMGLAEEAPVVKLVNSLIADAVRKGASDIHIEPYEKSLRVRFRIDGTLYEMMSPPFRMKAAILSRLKIMAELDIAERRIPQDGRIKIKVQNRQIDLRVSTLPTIFGEKIVMRILDKGNLTIDLLQAGFERAALDDLLKAIESPYGMVLVTGPTGSGKTTTLYSCLQRINVPETNIMTAEDPVEYNIEGINQVSIHEDIGLTFAAALRAFLRQDPNVIMVGEIRDMETASIATKAALTGHLVLSTLHTNDSASTLTRLIDMGVEPFLVSSSVNLIMAQRLVRRVCGSCKAVVQLHHEIVEELGLTEEEVKSHTFCEGKGCVDCSNTGYRGRHGVYEVMPLTPVIRDMILDRASASDIKRQAVADGMLSLRRDAIEKLKKGVTTAEEVLKETAGDNR